MKPFIHKHHFILLILLIQEIENAKYIEEARIGRVIWSSKRQEVTRDILELLENREDQQRMKDNMKILKTILSTLVPFNISKIEVKMLRKKSFG